MSALRSGAVVAVLVTATLLAVPNVFAQSSTGKQVDKKGLILGLGIGGGYVTSNVTTTEGSTQTEYSESSAAVAGDFRLGSGLSESFMLYWFGKTAWYNGPGSFGAATQTSTVFGLSGIGASYWLSPRWAVGAGVGVASLTYNRQTSWGAGFALGTEYEFAAHWVIGADMMFIDVKPTSPLEGVERDVSNFATRLVLGYLYY